ncbi:MAG: hypothetical protein U0936_11105 [Planctomycetaceae bacterium]
MYLLIDRYNDLNRKRETSLSIQELRDSGLRLVVQGGDRVPKPELDRSLMTLPRMVVNSYQEAFSTVLCGGNVGCLAYPQIMSPWDRSQYRIFELKDAQTPTMNLGLAMANLSKAKAPAFARHELVQIESLYDVFKSAMDSLAANSAFLHRNTIPELFQQQDWRSVHVSLDGDNRIWRHGWIRNFVVSSDGVVNGDQHFEVENGQQQISLTGDIAFGEAKGVMGQRVADPNIFHLVFRGRIPDLGAVKDGKTMADAFSIAITAKMDEVESGMIVGIWIGRSYFSEHRPNAPDVGYYVLYRDSAIPSESGPLDSDAKRRVVQLAQNAIEKHQKLYAGGSSVNLPLPSIAAQSE